MNKLWRAKELREEGDLEGALKLALEVLDANPNDPQALFQIGGIFIQTGKRGIAHNIMARCLKHAPESPEAWINYGRTLDDSLEGWNESEFCFKKALELNPRSRAALENMGALELQRCQPDASIDWCNKALKIDERSNVAKSTLGFAHLMKGEWSDGWKNYHAMMGHRSRPIINYGNLPEWDGTPGKTVIVNGEQGIGDELLYASMLPDMARDCKHVVYDCMERLGSLMRRSMPDNVHIAGQRWHDDLELPGHIQPDACITQAGVGMYYRNNDADFTGKPYLKADPNIRMAMRAMLESLGPHPKVGIAWTGGTIHSRQQFRQRTLEDLTPILRTPGITWVSLQYKDATDEVRAYKKARNIDVNHFGWVTHLKEYEHTAALVAELDLVISVPTSVTQLAGGMGIPTWVMVPEITGWLFSVDPYRWANSVRLFRNRPLREIGDELQLWMNRRRAA